MTVQSTTLDNGMVVLTDDMPHLESASLGVWVKAGARSERKAEHGISHLLEHMAFKGTTSRTALRLPKPSKMSAAISTPRPRSSTPAISPACSRTSGPGRRYLSRHFAEFGIRGGRADARKAGDRPGDRRRPRQSRRSRVRPVSAGGFPDPANRPHNSGRLNRCASSIPTWSANT